MNTVGFKFSVVLKFIHLFCQFYSTDSRYLEKPSCGTIRFHIYKQKVWLQNKSSQTSYTVFGQPYGRHIRLDHQSLYHPIQHHYILPKLPRINPHFYARIYTSSSLEPTICNYFHLSLKYLEQNIFGLPQRTTPHSSQKLNALPSSQTQPTLTWSLFKEGN